MIIERTNTAQTVFLSACSSSPPVRKRDRATWQTWTRWFSLCAMARASRPHPSVRRIKARLLTANKWLSEQNDGRTSCRFRWTFVTAPSNKGGRFLTREGRGLPRQVPLVCKRRQPRKTAFIYLFFLFFFRRLLVQALSLLKKKNEKKTKNERRSVTSSAAKPIRKNTRKKKKIIIIKRHWKRASWSDCV